MGRTEIRMVIQRSWSKYLGCQYGVRVKTQASSRLLLTVWTITYILDVLQFLNKKVVAGLDVSSQTPLLTNSNWEKQIIVISWTGTVL